MKILVINADDLGYSEERNEGIIDCFKKGGITNTTLLVNSVAAEHGVRRCKEVSLPIGMHFNLTEGYPVSELTKKSTLADEKGIFLPFRVLVKKSQDKEILLTDIKTELEAQMERFREMAGHYPPHIDGHHYSNIIPGIAEVFAEVAAAKGVKSTRIALDPSMMAKTWTPSQYADGFEETFGFSRHSEPIMKANKIRMNDMFFGMGTVGRDMTVDRIKQGLQVVFASRDTETESPVCEMMVHPGYRTGSVGGCGLGPDDFQRSEEREHELKTLTDPNLQEFYKQENVKLASYIDCW